MGRDFVGSGVVSYVDTVVSLGSSFIQGGAAVVVRTWLCYLNLSFYFPFLSAFYKVYVTLNK